MKHYLPNKRNGIKTIIETKNKTMKLSPDTLSAKLYRWFYNTSRMPSNLCPYFWKLVFMYLVILPYVIITLPHQILNNFKRDDKETSIAVSVILYLFMFGLVSLISVPVLLLFDLSPNDFWKSIFGGGVMIWIFLICAGIYHGIKYLIKRDKPNKMYDGNGTPFYGYDDFGNRIYYQEPKPNILVEFFKAKYNKYCPKIDWEK
jgi:hypothetical protein